MSLNADERNACVDHVPWLFTWKGIVQAQQLIVAVLANRHL